MPERWSFIKVPDGASSTVDRNVLDSVTLVSKDDILALSRFLAEQLQGEAEQEVEKLVGYVYNQDCFVVASWFGHSSDYAVGISSVVAGIKENNCLEVTDLILNLSRQGAKARTKEVLGRIASESGVEEILLKCGEKEVPFFSSLFQKDPRAQKKGEDFFEFKVSTDTFG